MYSGGPVLGQDYSKKPLYELFDELVKDGWKPLTFGKEEDTQYASVDSKKTGSVRVEAQKSGMMRVAVAALL